VTERYNTVIGVIFVLTILFSPTGILGMLDAIRKGNKLPFLHKFFNRKIAPQ
jgi:hypothetical protein